MFSRSSIPIFRCGFSFAFLLLLAGSLTGCSRDLANRPPPPDSMSNFQRSSGAPLSRHDQQWNRQKKAGW